MKSKVLNSIKSFDMLRFGNRITVALSGGADSVCLLFALLDLKDELGLELSAAHFNHKIRGNEAERDEAFCKAICKKNGVKLYVGSANVPDFAQKNGMSLELAARELRYNFFSTLDTDAVATAHTASDNLETIIFNLTRGTALSGLCGIPPVRDRYIRPLIGVTRCEVEQYCSYNCLEYITDSTNLEDDYTRNNIRHNIVPLLKDINPSLETTISRTSFSLSEDADLLDSISKNNYFINKEDESLNICEFSRISPAIAKRIIKSYYLDKFGVNPEANHINSIYEICLNGGRCSIPLNKTAVSDKQSLYFIDNDFKADVPHFDVSITESNNDLFENTSNVHNLLLKNTFDCDKIVGKLVVRTRLSGDNVRLANKNGTKTLKKLYTEYKIPLNERESLPVICDDVGIVWICGIGVADRCATKSESKRIYKIKVKKSFLGEN